MRAYKRAWIARRRAEWLAENGPCQWCGSGERLEVDHIDPSAKETHNVWSWAKPRRDIELAKCRVLCVGCHKKRHASTAPHGTTTRYKHKCRCVECRAANTLARRLYRAKQGRQDDFKPHPQPSALAAAPEVRNA